MSSSLNQFNLTNLIEKQKKDSLELFHNIEKEINAVPTPTNIVVSHILYDSGWKDIEPEDIYGSASQVQNLELPQRVPFEFTKNLELPELYLPFIDVSVLTKPINNQKVIGVGAFVYSGLEEVLLKLYDWQGITEIIEGGLPAIVEYGSGSLPSKPGPTMVIPFPSGCYNRTSYFTSVNIVANASMTLQLSSDGTTVIDTPVQVPPRSTSAVIASFLATYGDINGMGTFTWNFAQSVEFKHPPIDFPLPIDGKATLPCGSDVFRLDGQYWELQGTFTFWQYINRGHSYLDAKALFTKYYPDLFITPQTMTPPWKAYKRINNNVVEAGDLKIKITKTDNKNFQFSVYGSVLLVSPAITETDYSDPNFPTYQPDGDALSVKVRVTLKNHPVNFIETVMGRQYQG